MLLARSSAASRTVARRARARLGARPAASLAPAPGSTATIEYTFTDEAPALATLALLPVLRRFGAPAGVAFRRADISLAARVLAAFPSALTPAQRAAGHGADELARLGALVKTPGANVVKLPNVSASAPQLDACVRELRGKGFALPPWVPAAGGGGGGGGARSAAEADAAERYARVLGSAVNPVLREGNSDRRVAPPVKAYARAHPHKLRPWSAAARATTRVVSMAAGDFFGSEASATVPAGGGGAAAIEFLPAAGGPPVALRRPVPLADGDVVDAAVMSVAALGDFYEAAFNDAKAAGALASVHLKATMMKVSDPVLFGHAVRVFFRDVFAKHGAALAAAGANADNGLGDVLAKVAAAFPPAAKAAFDADLAAAYAARPALAMVDSRRGVTNLHVPSDVIIDASMPCVVRDGGCMWNAADALQPTHAIIPDRTYACVYDAVVRDVIAHGQFDVATMGSTANVGLMAGRAEEYGSHDKTFVAPGRGAIRVSLGGRALFEHAVAPGDVWRMCVTGDEAVRDWVKLAVARARATRDATVFWLDEARPHDAQVLLKVRAALARSPDARGLDISVLAPADAAAFTCARARAGRDTVSVTGNVLRDYLTDLFPILELGTSAKMLSIVPMVAGGGMYETGAGGSAPKHVQQFVAEGHLRWDSLGEYLAVAASLEDVAAKAPDAGARGRAAALAAGLNAAVGVVLDTNKSPSRRVGEIDNRGTTFYVALAWARAMARAGDRAYAALADALAAAEESVPRELLAAQGAPVDLGGYYLLDDEKAGAAMRPSRTFNAIIDDDAWRRA